ncbi:MAG TPA: serine/threonine-protein kinase [Solirubrobacteraceae bacterium]|nr:serine/threonine-protein kinase [Solirubrobacteraceae bacterium]
MSASRTPTVRRPASASEPPTWNGDAPNSGQDLVLSRYRLHRRLGSGAFGAVWMARDERLERDVAVKVLPRERVVSGRFEREARAAARLSHPGIVTLYEASVDDDGAYLVSELVSGSTLAELLQAGRLSDRDIAQIGVALCDALAHAHAHGVVHRDVKPSNVLIPDRVSTPSQLAKLTDFGVARVIGGDSLTRTGDVVGTAAYMAPEQAEGRQADATADLYSLALVLYEALTGVNPLCAGPPTQRARRLGAYLPPLRRHRRELPRELGRAIDLALRPRSRERGSIEELRQALAASVGRLDDAPETVGQPAPELPPEDPEPFAPSLDIGEVPSPPPLSRLLAGVAAAGLAAWVTGPLLHSSGVTAAVTAVACGVAVALLLRVGWLGLAVIAGVALVIQGRTGTAVLLLIGALIPVVLLPADPATWPLPGVAAALGVIWLAGAWPALAARAPSAWQRAALGAGGWIWLQLGTVLSASTLYAGLPTGIPQVGAWSTSPAAAVREVLSPLFTSGALTPALVWALAAVALPIVLRQPDLVLRSGAVAVWAAVVLGSTVLLLSLGSGQPGIGARDVLLGVAGGIAVALVWGRPAGAGATGPRHRRSAPTRVA